MQLDPTFFQKHFIGITTDSVLLVDHNPAWMECYNLVSRKLSQTLSNTDIKFFHIGSTAIPTIKAKPVLDILGVMENLEQFSANKILLEQMGFIAKGEFHIPGREFFIFYDEKAKISYVHLHIFAKDHAAVKEHLLFKERLLKSPELAQRYQQLKESLALQFANDRKSYQLGKKDFIERIIR